MSLTSYAGLELFRAFLAKCGVLRALSEGERRLALGGDFGFRRAVLMVVGMLLVGAERLRHVEFCLRMSPTGDQDRQKAVDAFTFASVAPFLALCRLSGAEITGER